MELGLTLGSDASKQQKKPFNFLNEGRTIDGSRRYRFELHTALSLSSSWAVNRGIAAQESRENGEEEAGSSQDGSSGSMNPAAAEDFRRRPLAAAEEISSTGSGLHSIMGLGMMFASGSNSKRAFEGTGNEERASDDDDESCLNGTRKKLRLSKDQSAYLEENFKEHSTLNPKQKLALAKQLSLRPRQVEVWFQNRRARTKLKQTEVECNYLKRCCETLTEENRKLHKELQDLRAINKASNNAYHMQMPATTLTMCPSCERVATTANNCSTGGKPAGAVDPKVPKDGIIVDDQLLSIRLHPFHTSHTTPS